MIATIRRVLLPAGDPGPLGPAMPPWRRGRWLARWLLPPSGAVPPFVAGYRLRFEFAAAARLRLHVSASERFRLFLDGDGIEVGPERGDPRQWRFHSYEADLTAGWHVLAAMVWALGEHGPLNQAETRPGFILAAEGPWHDRVSTGAAGWECRLLPGFGFEKQTLSCLTGERTILDARAFPWDWERGESAGFAPAQAGGEGFSPEVSREPEPPLLVPARLPPQRDEPAANGKALLVSAVADADADTPAADPAADFPDERAAWQRFLDGQGEVLLPPRTARRCLVDLGAYACVWPQLTARGVGGRVRLRYAEALTLDAGDGSVRMAKGDRREWRGKHLRGLGPVFLAADEVRAFRPLDWECGRYLEVLAQAGAVPLALIRFEQRLTGYPFSLEGTFSCDDPRLEQVRDLAINTLRVGTHETFCDCPYWERLQYVGDTRLEALATYCLQRDDRLQRQAIAAFAGSRLPNGLVVSRAPARGTQVLPPFALWWIGLLDDFARWRGDDAFVRANLPAARSILDAWWACRTSDGPVAGPPGWNFVDWVTGWEGGMSPGADRGVSAVLNWQLIGALETAARLEEAFGEPEPAGLQRRRASELAASLQVLWDDARGRWRDTPDGDGASEHAQILALLSGRLAPEQARRTAESLCRDADLARTTIYFTHYLFEAYRLLGRDDLLFQRLGLWFELPGQGLLTTPECPEPTRSECHPWGAHPLYHFVAGLAGIRPAAYGFSRVEARPRPGPLRRLSLRIPHPRGRIALDIRLADDGVWTGHWESPVPSSVPSGDLPAGRHEVAWRMK